MCSTFLDKFLEQCLDQLPTKEGFKPKRRSFTRWTLKRHRILCCIINSTNSQSELLKGYLFKDVTLLIENRTQRPPVVCTSRAIIVTAFKASWIFYFKKQQGLHVRSNTTDIQRQHPLMPGQWFSSKHVESRGFQLKRKLILCCKPNR